MDGVGVVVLAVAVLAVAGTGWGIVVLVRRQQYIKSLRARGWTFVNSPGFDAVARLGNPPFGLGFRREPDDQITGRTGSGRPFQVIEYTSDHWSGWVAMVALSRRLPELWVTGGETKPRVGVEATVVPAPASLGPGWQIGALDPAYAAEVLTGAVCERLTALAAGQAGVNLSIDGDQLVVLDPPRKDVDRLGPWLDQLATVADAIDAAQLDRWIQPEQPPRLTFYHHPDWHWIGTDDYLLQVTPVTRSGHDHSTSDVIRGRDGDGPPFVAFTHRWKTTHTESYTDSEGRTQTRTVVENHSEPVLGFQLPARMPSLEIGRRGFGRGISFESEAFNDQFSVVAQHTKFAYDVIHPRQMEYLMASSPASFRIVDDWAWFSVSEHSQPLIAHSSWFLRGFLARIPRFVWRDLGLPEAPYPGVLDPAANGR
ncbi:hypothetical protein Kfla_3881 [Kribbella flavida DSM 17836]|uniref:Uncharacterized protein n=1 Tax=Kribbella flavida (strain DSM 17836 / JCM 10339 / NBRC 14399) TaxID=479435 RepID=D2PQ10_KRIFD|nr:hypothetical protein [Kribbella flavida]ADB32934.1 hypothetical protein Kfla_3881 [Kribbella flavida DSM 17836]